MEHHKSRFKITNIGIQEINKKSKPSQITAKKKKNPNHEKENV